MTGLPDDVPGYQAIRMKAPAVGAEARGEAEARWAWGTYPSVLVAGPQFGTAVERDHGGWEVLDLSYNVPQGARDSLGAHFAMLAVRGRKAGDGVATAYRKAATRMDREALDELVVAGRRYRVIRADRFIRSGPDGLEPPRPGDQRPDREDQVDPVRGLIIDTVDVTTVATGVETVELLASVYPRSTVPPAVYEDSRRARHTHPGGVLLPAAFITAELTHGQWGPADNGTSPTPAAARSSLLWYLRVWAPYKLRLDQQQQARYAAAADAFEDSSDVDLTVAGHRFRIARVERLIRIGPDGPEGPRPSDWDPDPPPAERARQRREEGSEDVPADPHEDHQRFRALVEAEEERRMQRRCKDSAG